MAAAYRTTPQLDFLLPQNDENIILTAVFPIYRDGNEYFNAAAAGWDAREDMDSASDKAYQALLTRFPEMRENVSGHKTVGLDVIEIGCGTGLLSLRLAPHVRSLLAVDCCENMIHKLILKLTQPYAPENILPLCTTLTDPESSCLPPVDGTSETGAGSGRKKFDLAIGHLVLHHVPDLTKILHSIWGCLKPGGRVALTDYENFGPGARKFHPECKCAGVERHGIERKEFAELMLTCGFVDVKVEIGWVMQKEVERWPGEWGTEKPQGVKLAKANFPFLVCMGRRPEGVSS